MASPSLSRPATLQAHFSSPDSELRPVLTSLNGDNSWLVSFPRPKPEVASTGKAYYHVVVDPWLVGPGIWVHSWLSHTENTVSPAFQDGTAVEHLACEIETLAATANRTTSSGRPASPCIDAIFVSLDLPDHLAEATLRTFDRRIPVFTPADAATKVKSFKHFDTVFSPRDFTPADANDWRALHPGAWLPPWLNIFRIPALGPPKVNYVIVWIWTFGELQHEVMLHSPHGIPLEQEDMRSFVEMLQKEDSGLSVLAIMHSLKESFTFGMQTCGGVKAGVALERATRPRYWVKTADAVLSYSGIIGRCTHDNHHTLADGLDVTDKDTQTSPIKDQVRRPNFIEVDNGGSFILQ